MQRSGGVRRQQKAPTIRTRTIAAAERPTRHAIMRSASDSARQSPRSATMLVSLIAWPCQLWQRLRCARARIACTEHACSGMWEPNGLGRNQTSEPLVCAGDAAATTGDLGGSGSGMGNSVSDARRALLREEQKEHKRRVKAAQRAKRQGLPTTSSFSPARAPLRGAKRTPVRHHRKFAQPQVHSAFHFPCADSCLCVLLLAASALA